MLDKFKASILWCKNCELYKTRKNVIVGDGNEDADIIFVGEAPGSTEDEEGIPFCGRSGKLLRELITEAGIQDNIYITNIVKCRPPQNRDPLEKEIKACLPYLNQQIKLINPKIVVGVGRISSSRVIKNFTITRDHGKIYEIKNGMKFMGIYHPAYILRNMSKKQELLNDLIKLKNLI